MFFVFLLPIITAIGFLLIVVLLILIMCAIIFLVFTPLSVWMFVTSHNRKKENRRMVPFFPLGFIFANFALGGLVPFIALGVLYGNYMSQYPDDYVVKTMIDQEGYQSERFTVGKLTFKRIEGVTFLDKAYEMSQTPTYSYTYKNAFRKRESGNYYKVPTGTYTIIRGKKGKDNQYDYFARESQYDKVIEYFTSLSLESNDYYFDILSNKHTANMTNLRDLKLYLLDHISSFFVENYSENEKVILNKSHVSDEFFVNIFDENRYVCKGQISYCISDKDEWYLIDRNAPIDISYQTYKLSDELQDTLNYIYELSSN